MAEITVDDKLVKGGTLKSALTAVKGKVENMISVARPGLATSASAGLVKPGKGLSVDDTGAMSVVIDDVTVDPENIASATKAQAGVVKIGDGIDVADGVISVNHDAAIQTAKDFATAEVARLVNGAPETFDTFKEIADYIEEHKEVEASLNAAIGAKADKTTVSAIDTRLAAAETSLSGMTYMTDAEATAMVNAVFA